MVNGIPILNKQMSIYSGSESTILPINLWDKEYRFSELSNGMQFEPDFEDDDCKVYDNKLQRPLKFEYSEQESLKQNGNEIITKKYESSDFLAKN
jgi:hypothetical protein